MDPAWVIAAASETCQPQHQGQSFIDHKVSICTVWMSVVQLRLFETRPFILKASRGLGTSDDKSDAKSIKILSKGVGIDGIGAGIVGSRSFSDIDIQRRVEMSLLSFFVGGLRTPRRKMPAVLVEGWGDVVDEGHLPVAVGSGCCAESGVESGAGLRIVDI